ncbi:hypothetical protein V1477_020702 [Vespula maculifrons]|uniref:Uncharacterized protein n=1 Tax=Vespula maculifrons TaxID=7453 RepID=A0ABD2ANJ4_VESMC
MQLPPSGETWAIDIVRVCILTYKASNIEQMAAYFGHEEKKRLYAEEAPTIRGSRGQLSTTSHFFRGSYVSLRMARGLVTYFYFFTTLSFCSSVVMFITGDDGLFHLLRT